MKNKKLTKVLAVMAAVVFTLSGTLTAYAVESPGNGSSSSGESSSESIGGSSSSGGSCTVNDGTPTDCVVDVAKIPVTNGAMAERLSTTNVVAGERYNLGYVAEGDVVLPSLFEQAKASGAKITISSNAGTEVTWQFGLIENGVTFNPMVNVAYENEAVKAALANVQLTAGTKYKTVSFAHHGALPALAEVTIAFNQDAYFVEGETLYLYYCNPATNTFEFVDSAVYENHAGKFTMTHCSDYIVTTQPIPTVTMQSAPKTGDSMNYASYVIILVSALGLVAISMKKKNA